MTKKRQHIPFLHRSVDEVVRSSLTGLFLLVRGGVYLALHNIMAGTEVIVASHLALLPQTRTSNPLSKLLRPVLEHKRIRAILGANLAGALIVMGSLSTPADPTISGEVEVDVLPQSEVVVTTEQRFSMPVADLTGTSQGFSVFHRGVDMRAPLGTAIRPVANGRVVEIVKGKFGWGHYVVVAHEGQLSSLYAHMDKITVQLNQEITQETTLGTVGMTGWTTGPHLHLEVYEKGRAINPLLVVPTKGNS